jgi:hypothetical protein
MIVHGLDKRRFVVEKELTVTKEDGAILKYEDDEFVLERDYEVWNKIWTENNDGPNGFTCAFIIITNDCNKHCAYCYNEKLQIKNPGGPTEEQLINIMKKYIPNDTRSYANVPYKDYKYDKIHPILRYIGGEPTVAPTLKGTLKWAVENTGNKQWMCTNGILMQDKKFFDDVPKTNQIIWALSIDKYTDEDFIKRWTDNVIEYGGGNEYAYGIMIDDDDWAGTIKQDEILRTYKPQEIRYRGMNNEIGTQFPMVSDMMKFVEEARGIKRETFMNEASWYQQTLTCLNHKDTENSDTGNLVLARLPVARTVIAEMACNQASFMITTKSFWNPYEGHSSSPHLFKWRMSRPDKYYKEDAHKLFWDKTNLNLT